MKTQNLITVFLLVCLGMTFSVDELNAQTAVDFPILKLEKKDKGLLGYSRVDFQIATFGSQLGWSGECADPGLSRCKPPSTLPDPVDEANSIELSDYAMVQIANGSRGGTEQKLVQVSGESFMRVYTVTWTSTPVTTRPTPTLGDGQTIAIDVERTDI